MPELAMNLVADMAVHDSKDGSVLLVANAVNVNGTDENVDAAYHDAVSRLRSMVTRLATPLERTTVSIAEQGAPELTDVESVARQSWDRELFMSAIDRGKQAIVDGDIFQVVVSRRFEAECHASSLDVYRTLRRINPSPYMYLYSFEDAQGRPYSIVGLSLIHI